MSRFALTVAVPYQSLLYRESEIRRDVPAGENPAYDYEKVRGFELQDGSLLDATTQGWSDQDFDLAKRIGRRWAEYHGLIWEKDLSWAFVTSGRFPGMQIINQSPKGSSFEAVVMRTLSGRLYLLHDDIPAS